MGSSAVRPIVIASNGSIVPLSSTGPHTSPSRLDYRGYDHITWYVGNAKQAASYYITRLGFSPLAYRGLETGSQYVASHVVSNGRATFVLSSPIRSPSEHGGTVPDSDAQLIEEMYSHLTKHGDAVKDVAFEVDNVRAVYEQAIANGAGSVQQPITLADKVDGDIVTAVIRTFGNTTHTLVNRSSYHGAFLPGYHPATAADPIAQYLPDVPLEVIDHCVGNQGWNEVESACE